MDFEQKGEVVAVDMDMDMLLVVVVEELASLQ